MSHVAALTRAICISAVHSHIPERLLAHFTFPAQLRRDGKSRNSPFSLKTSKVYESFELFVLLLSFSCSRRDRWALQAECTIKNLNYLKIVPPVQPVLVRSIHTIETKHNSTRTFYFCVKLSIQPPRIKGHQDSLRYLLEIGCCNLG